MAQPSIITIYGSGTTGAAANVPLNLGAVLAAGDYVLSSQFSFFVPAAGAGGECRLAIGTGAGPVNVLGVAFNNPPPAAGIYVNSNPMSYIGGDVPGRLVGTATTVWFTAQNSAFVYVAFMIVIQQALVAGP